MSKLKKAQEIVSYYTNGFYTPFKADDGCITARVKCFDAPLLIQECGYYDLQVTGRVTDIYVTKSGIPMVELKVWF